MAMASGSARNGNYRFHFWTFSVTQQQVAPITSSGFGQRIKPGIIWDIGGFRSI